MANKLSVINAALRELSSRKLASLSEAREPRYAVDDIWDDVVQFCLEQGQWNYAIRTQEIEYTPEITPLFGFRYAFEKPSDWIRTVGLSASEYFNPPLTEYSDETGYWWANVDTLYVRYVSNSTDYGLDLSAWPATFQRFVELYLAFRLAPILTSSETTEDRMEKKYKKALTDARSKDAMNDSVSFMPSGSWTRSRISGSQYKNPERA